MKLLIVSNAPLIKKGAHWFAYAPYVRELEIWARHADQVAFCCPRWKEDRNLLIAEISFPFKKIFFLIDFNIKSLPDAFKACFQSLYNFIIILKAMYWADHIHIRCPGNIGLLAAIAQVFFASKIKTAKYAGNWDPKAKHPISYQFQKAVLQNSFFSRNMLVLVYGDWKNSSKNIKPFFTATYQEKDKKEIPLRNFDGVIKFVFVGTLTEGKRPLYAIQLIEKLIKEGCDAILSVYGEGDQRNEIEKYILENSLGKSVFLFGNKSAVVIQEVYQESHFVILPSKSEGWPKVIAEGMFWGCIPLATPVSCVPYMLDYGERGLLLAIDLEKDFTNIQSLIDNEDECQKISNKGAIWSRKFTIDAFESEIKLLLQS